MANKKLVKYEQYFLKQYDPIFELPLNNCAKVIEIGPGNGILTEKLNKLYDLTVVEIDNSKRYDNVNVIYANLKKIKYDTYNGIVGNIPYSYTHRVLQIILDNKPQAFSIGIQYEVGLRILDPLSRIGYKIYKNYQLLDKRILNKNAYKPVAPVKGYILKYKLRENTYTFTRQIDKLFTTPRKTLKTINRLKFEDKLNILPQIENKRIDMLTLKELDNLVFCNLLFYSNI